eukprot:CAMPEP_0201678108 /NCGR_PEP_ID=MMETSP0494-20130426/45561_1 /ASSEMBLY_ACC=CAM_ASM_000839 /TAXON_ID=420259 /ORGANISM="Thalassiosira gravida, Strain GMp14c1" /LENGTH=581 /DNA_ID=CAMNT_0048161217 /DNA_START=74 /DNA_END=1819 /DNA_ORIENTATION=+
MRFLRTAALAATLLSAINTNNVVVDASHVVSGTDARLPMSLSTVITDLEAEGASYVTTAAFLTSRSVRQSESAKLVRSLFGISGAGGHDDEVQYGTTTAFGKKLADSPEAEADASDGGSGVAIACPTCSSPKLGASTSEVASTVVACGGTVVYVADMVDLGRGEGLFDYFGPALERMLAIRAMALNAEEEEGTTLKPRPSTLIVVFKGLTDKREIAAAQKTWESAASRMLNAIIQPATGTTRATKLEDVFDRIEYLSAAEVDVDMQLCPAGGRVSAPDSPASRDPSEVAQSVSDVVNSGLVEDLGPMFEMAAKVPVKQACPRLTNPVDLAAARLLGPLASKALAECLNTVSSVTGEDGSTLVPEFGALCDAAIRRALNSLDEVASGSRFKKSPIAKRIRADLVENLYSEMGDVYENQVASLREAAFASFRGKLNKLRISPNLPNEMGDAAETSVKEFASAVKKLRVPRATSNGSWMTNSDQISSLRGRFAEHNAERLKAARASGQFKPVPRKGLTVGMHWLLPKPFGNDYRQEPHMTHTADDLVYAPVDGITDVSGNEIRSGDWRRGLVPAPSGGEMMYLK